MQVAVANQLEQAVFLLSHNKKGDSEKNRPFSSGGRT